MPGEKVVVWEIRHDEFGTMYPFSPEECQLIEDAYQKQSDNTLTQDFPSFDCSINFFKSTGRKRHVADVEADVVRQVYDSSSAAANQVCWQWNAGNNLRPIWMPYPSEVNELIEKTCQQNGNTFFDLSKTFPKLDYTLNFLYKFQTNNRSHYQRSIQRAVLPDKYPVEAQSVGSKPTSSATSNHFPSSSSATSNHFPSSSSATSNHFPSSSSATSNHFPSTSSAASYSVDVPSSSGADLAQRNQVVKKRRLSVTQNVGDNSGDGERPSPRKLPKLQNLPVVPELSKFADPVTEPPDEDCSICLGPLCEDSGFSQGSSPSYATVIQLKQCKHAFHSECLQAAIKNDQKKSSLTCPTCKTIYGVKEGNQPPGRMTHRIVHLRLPGYERYDTIEITYSFSSGVQSQDMPNPGQRYHASSFPRIAYLPNSPEGNKILKMLRIAFDRRLTFTISRSVTTGRDNVITWNEIHHKTEATSNYSGHGYPDPNYFANVTEELKLQGVTEDDIK